MSEERDIPTLEDLNTEIEAIINRLDQPGAAAAANPMDEIRNTILPLMKDIVASTSLGLIYVQDIAEPVELTAAEADEAVVLLKAFAAQHPNDPALLERIASALEPLEEDGDEDDDEDDEAEESN